MTKKANIKEKKPYKRQEELIELYIRDTIPYDNFKVGMLLTFPDFRLYYKKLQ